MRYPNIIRAENDILVTGDGKRCIDLFSAHGAVLLGHTHRLIGEKISEQLEHVWISGGLETPAYVEAKVLIESFFPDSHSLAALYSTGMESAEFAIRMARIVTGKIGVIGFEQSLHGKSLATAYLGWDNQDGVHLPGYFRLPFVQTVSEEKVLELLDKTLSEQDISAVFIEPLQGSGGGYMASRQFYRETAQLCRKADALLVFDEILTGFYRTGTPFFFSDLGFVPDIVLSGKAMGNGFPVSAVVADKTHRIQKEMLPGSTFAANPLASAAVAATLQQMQTLNLPAMVAEIEKIVRKHFDPLKKIGITPRGRGALWIIELPQDMNMKDIVTNIYKAGVLVGFTQQQLRLMPAATIELKKLEFACTCITEELIKRHNGR
jgi:acetylornithine/succinyldiaminopimelate/putrescine aminotransferase